MLFHMLLLKGGCLQLFQLILVEGGCLHAFSDDVSGEQLPSYCFM
jgi:hypothetical protein